MNNIKFALNLSIPFKYYQQTDTYEYYHLDFEFWMDTLVQLFKMQKTEREHFKFNECFYIEDDDLFFQYILRLINSIQLQLINDNKELISLYTEELAGFVHTNFASKEFQHCNDNYWKFLKENFNETE